MLQKRGFFFTVDAILAAGIIILVILFLSNSYIKEPQREHISLLSQDSIRVFTSLQVKDFENPYTQTLLEQGTIDKPNSTILEQIGEFWAENNTAAAQAFAQEVADAYIPERFGFGVYVDGEPIYIRNKTVTRSLISSRKIITGITKDKPIYGFSSRAFLKKIGSKKTFSYAYFGGFVGQGNITRNLDIIPSDAVVQSIVMEADAGSLFDLYINDNFCSQLTPIPGNLSSTAWDVSVCNTSINPGGTNNVTIEFPGLLNESYIAGGYVRVQYTTQQFTDNTTQGIARYEFPNIDGLINLFSSFDIPGTLNSLDYSVHFFNNRSTYFIVGNETLFETGGSSTDQTINISSFALTQSTTSIPIRLGSRNISESFNTTSGEPSDSVLVTDVSGSMDECGLAGTDQTCVYDCWWLIFYQGQRSCPYTGSCSGDQCGSCSGWGYSTNGHNIQNSCQATKMELAQAADLLFVDTVLNITGNEVGLVSYEEDVDSTEAITNIKVNLQNEINSYTAGGRTCICCGINQAKDMLTTTERKFMVVMSDGQENEYCSSFSDYTGSGSGSVDSIDAGQHACGLNITVFAVGFGEDADQDTLKQVACNESFYYNASNASVLTEVYQEISEQIIIIANFSSQVVTVAGDFQNSVLYGDSFIEFNYTPLVSPPSLSEIEITRETDKFTNCSPTVEIPNGTRILDARVVSYSGSHWTSFVSVNGNQIFNISSYGSDYRDVGDPFVVEIPATMLQTGQNQLEIQTADDPSNSTGCSLNNSMIYTLAISSAIDYGEPLGSLDGCEWFIELEDGGEITLKAPTSYSGTNKCYFNNSGLVYNDDDSYDVAVIKVLEQLDFDNDHRLDIDFDSDDLELEYITISDVPSLWGPAIVEFRVWE